jgi:hypothetical protein
MQSCCLFCAGQNFCEDEVTQSARPADETGDEASGECGNGMGE